VTDGFNRFSAFVLGLFGALWLSVLPVHAAERLAEPKPFFGWWEFGGYFNTDDTSRGEVVIFSPLAQSDRSLLFLDARGQFFEHDTQESNLALGLRQMTASGWNLGVWSSWDHRNTSHDIGFDQVSFGLEALSVGMEFRANGYVPLDDSALVSSSTAFTPGVPFAELSGSDLFVVTGGDVTTTSLLFELAYHGFDAEAGILLFGGDRDPNAPVSGPRHELRAYAGGFWFDSKDAEEEIAGPMGRLDYRIEDVIASVPGSRFTIESELSHDEVRDTRFEVGARLRIPFGVGRPAKLARIAELTGQQRLMVERLERDTDIITNDQTEVTTTTTPLTREGAIDDATDVALDAVSFASTAAELAQAVNLGGNRLIIVQDGGSVIDVSATEGQALQARQTVQGGASTILIRGKKTGEVVPFTAPGQRPTIFSSDDNTNTGIFTVNTATHLAGMNLRGIGGQGISEPGNRGVRGLNNLNNIVIEQMDIRNMGGNAIRFEANNSNIRILDSTLANIGGNIINFDDFNSDIRIERVAFSQNLTDAIKFDEFNDTVHVLDNTFTNVNQAIDFDDNNSNLWISGNTLTNLDNRAIEIDVGNRNVWITDNTMRNTVIGAIFAGSRNSNVTISGNSITDETAFGISIRDDNENITIADNVLNRTGQEGIRIQDNNTNVTIAGNIISNTGDQGISFRDGNTGVLIAGTTIANSGAQGIRFDNTNRNVRVEDATITDAGGDAISFVNDNENITIRNTNVTGGNDAVAFEQRNTGITISDSTFTGQGSDGINFSRDNDDVRISNVTITNPLREGIDLSRGNTNFTIENTSISGGAQGMLDGIELESTVASATTVTVNNVTISGAIANAIQVLGSGTELDITNSQISNTVGNGLTIGDPGSVGNVVTMNTTTFSGTFTGSVLTLDGASTLAGNGNVFNGIGTLCTVVPVTGTPAGQFTFVNPPVTCP